MEYDFSTEVYPFITYGDYTLIEKEGHTKNKYCVFDHFPLNG